MTKEGTSSIKEALARLRKQYGEGVVLAPEDVPTHVDSIPTGCYAIDTLLGCGGLPRGRIIEIYGNEGSGKSTLCLFFAAQVQKQGGAVVYVDVENAYDASYANIMGVETNKLMISQPETLEESFDIIRAMAETNEVDLIIVDSIAALTPKAELESVEMFKETMALQARLIGKGIRIITGPVSRSKTVVIFINQVRSKVGVVWGNPDVTPGGKSLKFFSSVRLNVTKGDKILGVKEEQIGNTVKVNAVKNKVGMPFKKCTFDLYYGSGVDLISDLFDTAVADDVIVKTGNTYKFNDSILGVGRDKAISALRTGPNEEVRKALTIKLKM